MLRKKIIDGVLHTVGVVVFKRDKVLMFLREGKEWEIGWEIIKGGVYFGETEEHAALREVKEEASINTKIIGKLPDVFWAERPWRNGKMKIKAHMYVCEYVDGEVRLGEKEHIDWKWMSPQEAKKLIILKNGKKILDEAMDFYKKFASKANAKNLKKKSLTA